MIAHGFPRTTGDLNLLANLTRPNAGRVVRAQECFGYTRGEFEEADFTKAPNFLSSSARGVWIDLMTSVLGIEFEEAAADALEPLFADVPVCYIGLAALRATKLATGRPQDLRDLKNLSG